MKKIITAAALLTVSSLEASSFQGFYAGLGLGYKNVTSKVTATDIDHAPRPSAGRADVNIASPSVGITVSYLHAVSDSFVGGVELAGSFNPASRKFVHRGDPNNTETWNLKLKSSLNYSAAVVIGVAYNKVLPYVKVGAEGSAYKVALDRTAGVGIAAKTMKVTKRPLGVLAGLGIQFPVSDNIYMGTEYAYTHFVKKVKLSDAEFREFVFKPSAHTFKVKIAYKF